MPSEDRHQTVALICRALRKGRTEALVSQISDALEGERTETLGLLRTPCLISLGQELGRALLKEGPAIDALKRLWRASQAWDEPLEQGLLGGRHLRLIVIGALGVLSKREYEKVRAFVMDILEDIKDWETCDQLALRVVVNLAIKDRQATFGLLRQWLASGNRWIRRLAVATIPPYIRACPEEADLCLGLLEGAMREQDRQVKKALGWALREITKKDKEAVFRFLRRWAEVEDKHTRQIIKEGMKKLPQKEQAILREVLSKG